jgi:hypothetical protein
MTLHEAQVARLDRICRKLDLQPTDHLLEIGTGWGGMALHAAGKFGCRVTTTTISRRQYEKAVERVRAAGLEERVTVLFEDYRDLSGSYATPTVTKLQGRAVSSTAPTTGQALIWDGSAWTPTASSGDVQGPASATANAVALYNGTTGKLIKNSTLVVDGSGNITGAGTYNGVTVTAHAARHAPGGADALGTAAPTQGIGAANTEGTASTFARSDHNHTLRTDGVDLTIGTIADGQYLKRVGTVIEGAAAAGAAKTLTGNFVGTLDAPVNATARWYPPSSSTVTRAWASLGEHASGVTEFDVLKNGSSILPAPISISTGDYRSLDVTVPSVVVGINDYLTVSLTTANGGSNAVVFVEYV